LENSIFLQLFITLRASAVNVSVCVCGSVTTITRNCMHRSSQNWVCR